MRWTYASDDWLAWRVGYIENEHQAPGGLTRAQFAVDRFANARPLNHFSGFRAVSDLVRHVGDGEEYVEYFAWAAQTRRNLHRQDPAFGAATGVRVTDDDAYNANLGVRGSNVFDGGGLDHDLYWGVRASQELIPDRTTVTEPLGGGAETRLADVDFKLSAFSAHVDDTLRPTEDLTIVAGVRAEWVPVLEGKDHVTGEEQDDDAFELLPGASVSYQVADWSAVFANYQQSFRAPQAFGLDTTLADPDQDLTSSRASPGRSGCAPSRRWACPAPWPPSASTSTMSCSSTRRACTRTSATSARTGSTSSWPTTGAR